MTKQVRFFTFLFLLSGWVASAQVSVPTVPERLTFADISVQLDPDARRLIQQDVNALYSNKQYWMAKLDRAVLYFPIIEAVLIDEEVPTDFKYLAVQESSLTPDAVSSSTAVGYWQFKKETAIGNGLRVDDEIDERKSINASTHGAAKYLKKSNTQFNNWVASLYSYYLGAGGIAKLIPPDWSYAREVALDGKTDRYILRFFAHKIALENALQTHQTSNRIALVEYPNGGGKNMRTIADELGIDELELRKYNRWVLADGVPTDKTYVVVAPVPTDQINDVRQKIVSVEGRKPTAVLQDDIGFPVLRKVTTGLSSKNEPVLYEINGLPGIQAQAGDDAASLARKAKVSYSSFLRYNDMSERDPIIVGDVYYLAKKRKKALVPFHTVREGETARSISQRYGIRLKKLMRFNRLDRIQKLATGRIMWLRERRPANKPVEIINAPTPPVYDQTPTPPTRSDVAANTNNGSPRTVSGMGDVPRNASERKLYQPKLVGGGVTPNDGTSEPAAPQRPVSQPVDNPPLNSRSMPAPSSGGSTASDGSQRVVIVRSSDGTQTSKTVPVATTPQPDKTTGSGIPSKAKDTYASTQRPKTNPTNDEDMGRPESGKYEGPREQQADGSITAPSAVAPTKAPPRPAASMKTVKTESPATGSVVMHTVEAGQTYYSISKRYGVTVEQLLAMNDLTMNNVLEVGQKLIVKPGTADPSSAGRTTPATGTSSAGATYHTVEKGETMFRIAQQYGVSVEQIQEWNNLSDPGVKVGQKLKILKN